MAPVELLCRRDDDEWSTGAKQDRTGAVPAGPATGPVAAEV